jgi:hypothetical protein
MGLRLEEKLEFDNASSKFLKKYKGKKKFLRQYATQILKYPSQEQFNSISQYVYKVWGSGDSFQKLAYDYYGDPELWWIIPWINQKPTEFHLSSGDILYVPTQLVDALALLGIE